MQQFWRALEKVQISNGFMTLHDGAFWCVQLSLVSAECLGGQRWPCCRFGDPQKGSDMYIRPCYEKLWTEMSTLFKNGTMRLGLLGK